MNLSDLRAKLVALLQGEPLRAIVYGAAVVVFIVAHIALALGYQGFGEVGIDTALGAATAAAALLTELSRRFVTPVAAPTLPAGTEVTVTAPTPSTVTLVPTA